MKVLFCDIDGTLAGRNFIIPQKHIKALEMLKKSGWYLVAATGRNPFSIEKVLTDETPFDEVMFTTGVGVMQWPSREIIYSLTLEDRVIKKAISLFDNLGFDVMVQQPHPENHHFFYLQKEQMGDDTQRRLDIYQNFAKPLDKEHLMHVSGANVVAVGDESDTIWNQVVAHFPEAKVVRATSPLDGKSMWIEIYPKGAGKAAAAQSIAERLNILPKDCVGIGNDYNDIELL
ncbi:MAG: hypothetical protein DRJ64_04340, partial [Thermoprotei archaeon]